MQKIIKRVITLVLMGVHGGENWEERERQFNTSDSNFFRDKTDIYGTKSKDWHAKHLKMGDIGSDAHTNQFMYNESK